MYTISQTIIHTPVWVYILLVFLISWGFKASQPRIISLRKLLILPIVFLFLSIHSLAASFNLTTNDLLVWASSLLVGSLLGWMLTVNLTLKVDREHALIQLPGTWIPLILMLVIFATSYVFHYELATNPMLATNHEFEFSMLATSGVITGCFIGRLICYLRRFKTLKSVDLTT